MATEYKLNYTASDIDKKLGKIDKLSSENEQMKNDISVANVRINQITTLQEGSTTGDAELIDIRVGANGEIYSNAGDAVREQIKAIKNSSFYSVEEGYSENFWIPEETVIGFLGQSTPTGAYATTNYFIPVKQDAMYCTHKKTQAVWGYDKDYNVINKNIVLNTVGVTIPNNVKYIKVSFATANSEAQLLACAIYESEKYETLFPNSYIPRYNLTDESYEDLLKVNGIKAQNLTQRREKGLYGGVIDLSNKYSRIYNLATNAEYQVVKIDDTSDWSAYGVEQVLKITYAQSKGFWFTATADSSGINMIYPKTMGFEVGDTVYLGFYARHVRENVNHVKMQFENGSTFNNYSDIVLSKEIRLYEFSKTLTEDNINGFTFRLGNYINEVEISNMYITDKPNNRGCIFLDLKREDVIGKIKSEKFKDKTWLACGDSITNNGFYLYALNKWFPFGTLNNIGVNGTCMAGTYASSFCNRVDEELVESITESDVITLQYGTNDIRYIGSTMTMGTLAAMGSEGFDKTTIYGAWQYSIEKILSYNPNAKIIVILPPSWTSNQMIEEYCNAVKEVCMLYKIKCVDVHASCGWNMYTQSILTPDGVHPSRKFGTQCAAIIAPAFEEIVFDDETK